MSDTELLDFIDWYRVVEETLYDMTSEQVKNMYLYYLNNKL